MNFAISKIMRAVNRLHKSLRPIAETVRSRWCSTSNSENCYPIPTQLPWTVVEPFGSIRVDLTRAYSQGWNSQEIFHQLLHSHTQKWKCKGHSSVWLHIPIPLSGLISLASEQGFTLHHGNQSEIVMNKWLQDHRTNRLPPYASHQVGVCGVVLREDTYEILVTQDKYKPPLWKFPGGLSEFAEDISDAAVREVREETGILTEFQSILAFRQQHKLSHYFNVSDLYFICRMTPLSFKISHCQEEVLKCQWIEVEKLAHSQDTTPLTLLTTKVLLEARVKGFKEFDIRMHEIEMNIPWYSSSKSYKLFLS